VPCCVGRSGRSISLVTQYDVDVVQKIEALIGKQLEEFSLDEEDVLEYFKETLVAKRKARMVSGLNYRHPTLFHVGSNNSSFLRKSVLHV
jgi:superfamily II DNA/RNA helicase